MGLPWLAPGRALQSPPGPVAIMIKITRPDAAESSTSRSEKGIPDPGDKPPTVGALMLAAKMKDTYGDPLYIHRFPMLAVPQFQDFPTPDFSFPTIKISLLSCKFPSAL